MPAPPTRLLALLLALAAWLAGAGPAAAQVLPHTFAAGATHSLSIHADGTLWATGGNASGQLGTGNTTSQAAWVPVGTATTWTQVVTGANYSLGLRTDGSLWAWGSNFYGVLGTATGAGTSTANSTPVRVGTAVYKAVAAGTTHVLALRADGTLWAWGGNQYGQLGSALHNGTLTANPTPAQVGTARYVQVAAGGEHSLALQADGTLWAWGNNQNGQLGVPANAGAQQANPAPTQVGTALYRQVSAGYLHSLALRADGTAWAWGLNANGELGVPLAATPTAYSAAPLAVGTAAYTQLAAGGSHSLALRADGTVWAWGFNQYGELGNTTNINNFQSANPTPTQLGTGTQWARVSAGFYHTLLLRADGSLWACGSNQYRQLGLAANAGTTQANPALAVTGTALPTRSTAVGSSFAAAIRADGALLTWGYNEYGQLGDGTTTNRPLPTLVGTDHDWVQVAAGYDHVLALKADGTAWVWGRNHYHQAAPGSGALVMQPTQVSGYRFSSVAAGWFYNLALTAQGELLAWGNNSRRQLGVGSTANDVAVPTAVVGAGPWRSAAAGGFHSLAVAATGAAYGWGDNQYGQAGIPSQSGYVLPVGVPTAIPGLPPVAQVQGGRLHSLALDAAGGAYSWGANNWCQLGQALNSGTAWPNAEPTAVAGVPLLAQVGAYDGHSLALTTAGTIYGWGINGFGELGQGLTSPPPGVYAPAQEIILSTAWAGLAVGSGGTASVVRTASGLGFASAGSNGYGALGDGLGVSATRFDRPGGLGPLLPLPVRATAAAAPLALVPNPARGRVRVQGAAATATLAVYDALGRLVLTGAGPVLDASGLAPGSYVVQATAPGQLPQVARLVVE